MQNNSSITPPPRAWIYWAAFLSVIYVGVSLAGGGRTLGGNETWALYYASQPLHEQMLAIRSDLVHPPLIYLLQRAWLTVFGQSDTAVKVLPLVVGLPAIILFTWLASLVTTYWRLASFLFSSAYLQVGSDLTQVRMYGLAVLLTVIGMVLWKRWREQPTNANLMAWAAAMVLLVYTHLFGSLIVFAFVLVNWCFGRRQIAFTATAAAVGLALMPWLIYVLPVYQARGLGSNLEWVSRSTLRGLAGCPLDFMGMPPVHIARSTLDIAGCVLFLMTILIAWRAFPVLWRARKDIEPAARWFWTALLLAIVPVLILFLFSIAVTPSFSPRFVLGVVPSMWLVLVLLAQFGGRRARVVLYALFLPWVLVSAAGTVVHARIPSDARRASAFLAHEARPTDLFLCDGGGTGNRFDWEWRHRLGRSGRIEILKPSGKSDGYQDKYPGPPETILTNLDLSGTDRIWYFFDRENPEAESMDKMKAFLLSRGYVLQGGFPEGDAPFLLTFTKSAVSGNGSELGIFVSYGF